MNKLHFLTIPVVLLLAGTGHMAYAQDKSGFGTASDAINSLSVAMDVSNYKESDFPDDFDPWAGVSVAYLRATPISGVKNLYWEIGGEFKYTFDKWESHDIDYINAFSSISIPADAMYLINLSKKIKLAPFAGLDATMYLSGTSKSAKDGEELSKYDYFKDGDENEDGKIHRLTLGYHIGARLYLNRFFIGVTYQPESTLYSYDDGSKDSFAHTKIALGIRF